MSQKPERTFDTIALLILGGVLLAIFLSGCGGVDPERMWIDKDDAPRQKRSLPQDSRAEALNRRLERIDNRIGELRDRQDAQERWNEAAEQQDISLEHELFQMKVIVGSILLRIKELGPEWDDPANVPPAPPAQKSPLKRKSSQPRFAIG